MEERVAELCSDAGYELLPTVAYTNALSSALSFYLKAKPRIAHFVASVVSSLYIPIPNNLNPPFNPHNGSKIEAIEFISRQPNVNPDNMQTIMSYIRKDVYVLTYSDNLQQYIIKFVGRLTGTYRVYYTYHVGIQEMQQKLSSDELDGIIYLAASFACEKIAAKFARVFTNKIPADVMAFRDKVNYYNDIANEYREIAYNILDINERTGTMAYSTIASWGARKVRRII